MHAGPDSCFSASDTSCDNRFYTISKTAAFSEPFRALPILGNLLIVDPAEGKRLSWPEHAVGQQRARGC